MSGFIKTLMKIPLQLSLSTFLWLKIICDDCLVKESEKLAIQKEILPLE